MRYTDSGHYKKRELTSSTKASLTAAHDVSCKLNNDDGEIHIFIATRPLRRGRVRVSVFFFFVKKKEFLVKSNTSSRNKFCAGHEKRVQSVKCILTRVKLTDYCGGI